jgi:hypothetical protein
MVDQTTAAFVRSALPEPRQRDLDRVLERTTSVGVSELVFRNGKGTFQPVLTAAAGDALAELAASLRIVPESFGHLMSVESHRLECFAGEQLLCTILLVGPSVLRWPDRWKSDAPLAEPEALADYFAARGYPNFRDELRRQEEAVQVHERRAAKWSSTWDPATPAGLSALVADLQHEHYAERSPAREKALRILAEDYPSVEAQVLSLLRWFGHALGPWSGYPSEESAPESLLEALPHEAIVRVVRDADLSPQQLDGAARFLCRWAHPTRRKRRQAKLPAEVRAKLWAYVLSTGDEDKIHRARKVLGS